MNIRFFHGFPFLKPGIAASLSLLALAAQAAPLPSPYVSRALDAVLIPVNADTTAAFGLPGDEAGVLVLATQPGGTADLSGIAPGDVISAVQGELVTDPILLDEIVYYWIAQGMFDFGFDTWRDGAIQSAPAKVTMAEWTSVVDVTTIASWTAYSSESFSYSEYYSEYSEDFAASYESSEAVIEETAGSEDFAAEVTADQEAVGDFATEDGDAAMDSDDGGDEATVETGEDDGAAMDDGGGDDGGDDTTGDEE